MSRRSKATRRRKVRERSAGAVVFHEDATSPREFLLLRYGAGHWGFPKGHVEPGETDEETAKREITEETGIPPEAQRLLPGFEERTDYHFNRGSTLVEKEVRFFLVEAHERNVRISHEHTGFAWLPFEQALQQVSFEGPRRVLHHADAFLTGRGKEQEARG